MSDPTSNPASSNPTGDPGPGGDGLPDDDELDPLEGLLDPEEGTNTPAGDADAPPPG